MAIMIRILAVVCFHIFGLVLADTLLERQQVDGEDSPLFLDPSHYVGHNAVATITVGDYLYFAGGEIYYIDENNTVIHSWAQNSYSIDMTVPWSNSTVSIRAIPGGIDGWKLNEANLWHSQDNSSYYVYNGAISGHYIDTPPNRLYEFTSDGSGSGDWSEVTSFYTASSNFTTLSRVNFAADTCGPDTCYAVGGMRNRVTTSSLTEDIPAAGVVSYNKSSQQWFNDSMIGDVWTSSWIGGHVFFTDIIGSQGGLVALGGATQGLSGTNSVVLAFDYVYLYDLATKTWYQQKTTGDVPGARGGNCAVGIRGDNTVNRTFEIFIHGGNSASANPADIEYDDVSVLSLPSFSWHKAGLRPVRIRGGHECTIAGQRQMILVGGLDASLYFNESAMTADVWPLGLNVFDMTNLTYKDQYEPDAQAYSTADVIKEWYTNNGPMALEMDQDVANLFTESSSTTSDNSTSTDTTGGSATEPASAGGSNIGAIAGGVVGGVVAFIALIVGVWFFRRRKHRQTQHVQSEPKVERGTAQAVERGHEVDGNQIYESGGKTAKTSYNNPDQRHELQ